MTVSNGINFSQTYTKRSGLICALVGAMFTLGGCDDRPGTAEVSQTADIIVINADIRTLDPEQPKAEAFAVLDGHFQALGSTEDMRKLAGPKTQIINAGGATVTPGFVDAHTHLMSGVSLATGVDLTGIASKDEWLRIVADKVTALEDGAWLLGGGWNHALSDGILPSRQMLDAVSPNNPVFLYDIDGHTVWANSKALELAGITADSEVPDGGEIVIDPATGEPTGILKEGASQLIRGLESFKAAQDPSVGVLAVIAMANRYGITSVHDMSRNNGVYVDLAENGELNLRIWSGTIATGPQRPAAAYAAERELTKQRLAASMAKDRGPIFQHGYTKLIVDGVLSTYTALMKEPYSDNADANPIAIMSEDDLVERIRDAHEHGFPVAIHAIGDRGVQMALNAFERAGHPSGMLADRIEHIEVVTPDDVARFKDLGIVASMQPIHATCCVGDYVISRIGEERMPNAYAWRRMLDSGVQLSLSSDWPTSPINPLEHIANAMLRETKMNGETKPWDKGQSLTFDEALYAYIQSSANLSPWGSQIGSITVGKWADFVIFDAAIDDGDAKNIAALDVRSTYLAGGLVYQK